MKSGSHNSPKYRPEIDGLRALAILSVMTYHAFPDLLTGGFVGVDVFFVISGYLISSIIISGIEKENFSTKSFLIKRIKRIFPSLIIILLASIVISLLLLTPQEIKTLGAHIMSSASFIVNFVYWHESGYFDLAAITKPLLHIWSLSIEEQFYLFWPFIFLISYRTSLLISKVVVAIMIFSLLVNIMLAVKDPNAAFYFSPARFWELCAGSFIAIHNKKIEASFTHLSSKKWITSLPSTLGVLLILASFYFIDKNFKFVSLWNIFPVLGTALVISSPAHCWINRKLLSLPLLVWIGLISYPLYLWHWPILSFAFLRKELLPSVEIRIFALILSFFLAWLTYKLVEKPIRKSEKNSAIGIVLCSLMLCTFVIGYTFHSTNGLDKEQPPNIKWNSLAHRISKKGNSPCYGSESKNYEGVVSCSFGDLNSEKEFVLYGDSHAEAISFQLNKSFKEKRVKGLRVWLSNCQAIAGLRQKGSAVSYDDCNRNFQSFLHMIENEKLDVIIVIRWNFRLYPVPGHIEQLATENSEGGREIESNRYFEVENTSADLAKEKERLLNHFISKLIQTGRNIFLVYPIPETSLDIYKVNRDFYKNNNFSEIKKEISLPYRDVLIRNKFVNNVFDSIPDSVNFHRIKPEEIFCDTFIKDRCAAQIEGVPFYLDDDHLSDEGAQLIIDKILQ